MAAWDSVKTAYGSANAVTAPSSVLAQGIKQAEGPMSKLIANDPTKRRNVGTPYDPTKPAEVGIPGVGDAKAATVGTVADPRIALINAGPQNQFRDQQMLLAQQLVGQATGQAPSIAEAQLRRAQDGNIAATFAQLNSNRGNSPAMARNTMATVADIQTKTAQEAAVARLQEQMEAAGMLGAVSNQGRAADIDMAKSQAQIAHEANIAQFNQANENARLNANLAQQFEVLKSQYASMGIDAARANQMAALEIEKMRTGNATNMMAVNAAENTRRDKIWGTAFGGATGYAVGGPSGATQGANMGNAATGGSGVPTK